VTRTAGDPVTGPAGAGGLRLATASDAPGIGHLLRTSLEEGWSDVAVALVLAAGAWGLVEEAGGEIVAAVLVRDLPPDECEILQLAIAPLLRRRGMGRSLLRAALERAGRAGLRSAFLEVRTGNGAARALYADSGFVEAGRRRMYYSNGEDAIVMRREGEGPERGGSRPAGPVR
jgi:ribosomal-protein-alanine N-acetyltransferase